MQRPGFLTTARPTAPSRRRLLPTFALALVAISTTGVAAVAAAQVAPPSGPPVGISASGVAQMERLRQDKETWSEAERKLDTELLFALKRARGDALFAELPELRTGRGLALDDLVEVVLEGTVDGPLEVAVQQLGTLIDADPGRSRLRARLPLRRLMALAERRDVRRIHRTLGFEVRKDNTSQGDVAHQADLARALLGVDGSGVRVGVLSDGIDTLADRQATGDLPTVQVISGQAGAGDEGTAMLEIVHDLAPGAELWFATAFGGMAQFAANIAALAAAGCEVIVDDVFYFAEATFQDGVIAQAVNDFTDAGGLYFSSAGNSGNLNDGTSGVWEGDYVLSGSPNLHHFGGSNANLITVDSPSWFILQWSDPLAGSGNDYDLYLVNSTGTAVLDSSQAVQDGDDDPFEFISSVGFDDTGNLLAINRFGGDSRFLWLNTNRGRLAQATAGQTSGHSAAADAFGVAAVYWAAAGGAGGAFDGSESVEWFSSDGPRRVFFAADGTPLTPGDFSSSGGVVRQQPRIAGADGVSTAAPGFDPFFGTSAAAPHVAAIAALLLEHGDLTPTGLDQLFAATALDIEAPGFDRDSGHGIANAVSLVSTILPGGLGGTPPECAVDHLTLTGDPNDGPQTFRACQSITASAGSFDDLTLIAYDTVTATPGRIVLASGFTSAGPLVLRTVTP